MACDDFSISAARSRCLAATRDVKAVSLIVQQCRAQGTIQNPNVILPLTGVDASVTVQNAQAAMGGTSPTNIDYNTVDDYVSGCALLPLLLGQYNDRFSQWQNCDVALKVHFVRQTLRFALPVKSWLAISTMRSDPNWMFVRLGLRLYSDLARINLTATRLQDAVSLITAARGVDTDPTWGARYQAFLGLAGGLSVASGVVPSGLGIMDGLMQVIQALNQAQAQMLSQMTSRLSQPDSFMPNDTAIVSRACAPCRQTGCGYGLSINSVEGTIDPVGGVPAIYDT